MGGMGLGKDGVAGSKSAMRVCASRRGIGRPWDWRKGEPVTPVFPNSDHMTGVAGAVGILIALMRRAEGAAGRWISC
jgi:crotonobetainyl-CoA:carnitine CoA-transferase CaiB-like acyl-CoA transferase